MKINYRNITSKLMLSLIILSLIYIIDCSRKNNQYTYEMKVQKTLTIGDDNNNEKYDFAAVSDIIADPEGNIYICDNKDHCLKIYTSKGVYVKSIGKKGQGPGELLGPQDIEWGPDEKIYIYESGVGNRRISIFYKSGEFIANFNYRMHMLSGMAIDPGTGYVFLAEQIMPGSEIKNVIQKYTTDGNFIKAFCNPFIIGESTIGTYYGYVNLTFLSKSQLLVYPSYPYELRLFSIDGDLIKVISRDSPIFSKPKEYTTKTQSGLPFQQLLNRGWVSKCIVLPDGNFLIRIIDLGENFLEEFRKQREAIRRGEKYIRTKNIYYDYFDSNGRYLQTFDDPFNGGNIRFIDLQNFIYVSNTKNDIPVVEKYKIEFLKKVEE